MTMPSSRRRPKHRARRKLASAPLLVAALALAAFGVGAEPGSSRALFTDQVVATGNVFTTDLLDAPSGLTITKPTSTENRLSWTATPDTYADGYKVFRAAATGGPYTEIATVNGRTNTSYTDTPAPSGTSYYRVRAFRYNWTSADTAAQPGSVPLPAPTGVTAAATGPTAVRVDWNSVTGATGYNVYYSRCTEGALCGTPNFLATTTGTSYAFDEAREGTFYRLQVAALDNASVVGTKSGEVSTKTIPKFTQSVLSAEYGYYGGFYEQVRFDHGSTSTTIDIERSIDGGAFAPYMVNITNYGGVPWYGSQSHVTGWTPPPGGYDYRYRAKGCNTAGCTYYSEPTAFRVPYWYPVAATATWRHRMQQTASGGTSDYSWVHYYGTDADFGFSQCPAFRSCTGNTDTSVLLKNPRSGAGYLYRSGSLDPANPGGNAARTIEFFYKQSGAWRDSAYLFGHKNAAGTMGAGSMALSTVYQSGYKIAYFDGGGSTAFAGTSKIADGQWHLYHLVYNGGQVILYEDGVLLGTIARSVNTGADQNMLLGFANNATIGAIGWYDEWAVYNWAFTATEVGEHWRARADGD